MRTQKTAVKTGYDYAETAIATEVKPMRENMPESDFYTMRIDYAKLELLGIGIRTDETGINLFLLDIPNGLPLTPVSDAILAECDRAGYTYEKAAELAHIAIGAIEQHELKNRLRGLLD